MTTSGTVGQTLIDAAKVIEHAARKCGVVASNLSSEQLLAAQENLYLRLISLANRGINLWCVETRIYPFVAGVSTYTLPLGANDVLQALYRWGTYTPATTLALGAASLTLATATDVQSVSVTVPSAGDYSLVVESSPDGVNWTQRGAASWPGLSAGATVGVDAPGYVETLYWRVRETVLSVTFTAASFLSAGTEIPMSKLSRDDYSALPNKSFTSGQPLQFWLDKQRDAPVVSTWPVPSAGGPQMVLWLQRAVQDVGALSNTLDVPNRWLNALIFELAEIMYLELPKEQRDNTVYEAIRSKAEEELRRAEDSERDGTPVKITPNIGVYTRG